jgi:anti-anti-sigma factor
MIMSVQVIYTDGNATLAIRGRFDFNIHKDFRTCSEEALAKSTVKSIEVNLREVSYLDSSALGMLLLLRDKAEQSGGKRIVLCAVSGMVEQVLEVANFDKLFTIR